MSGTVGFRSVGLIIAVALAGMVYTARPAYAGGDLGKVLAGAAVGYLVYKALDHDEGPGHRHHQRCYKPPPPRHHHGRVGYGWGQYRWDRKCDHRGCERDRYRDRDRGRDRGRGWGNGHEQGRDRDHRGGWDRGHDRDQDRDQRGDRDREHEQSGDRDHRGGGRGGGGRH